MEVFNACPHHGLDTWMLVSYFYEGMSPTMKQLLETMCKGDFMSKSPDEALDFLKWWKYLDHGMNLMEKTQAKPSPKTILKEECTL